MQMNILQPCPTPEPLKALSPYPTSRGAKLSEAKAALLSTINALEEFEHSPTTYKLLENIIFTFLCSGDEKILNLGWECAIDNYSCRTQNWAYGQTQGDEDNPRNWEGYQE